MGGGAEYVSRVEGSAGVEVAVKASSGTNASSGGTGAGEVGGGEERQEKEKERAEDMLVASNPCAACARRRACIEMRVEYMYRPSETDTHHRATPWCNP
jgi:hypothetical protein